MIYSVQRDAILSPTIMLLLRQCHVGAFTTMIQLFQQLWVHFWLSLVPLSLFSQTPQLGSDQQVDLTVIVEGLRTTGGTLRVSLFDSPDGFPDQPNRARAFINIPVTHAEERVVFRGLPSGTFGIGVLHDEDDNETMTFSLLGWPIEGYACSNNARGLLGPPKFSKAAFELGAGQPPIHRIRMRY